MVDGIKAFYGVHVGMDGVPILQRATVEMENDGVYMIKPIIAFGHRTILRKIALKGLPEMFPTSEREAWEVFKKDLNITLERTIRHLGVAESAIEALDAEEAREALKRC